MSLRLFVYHSIGVSLFNIPQPIAFIPLLICSNTYQLSYNVLITYHIQQEYGKPYLFT
jgi:hypothetical protein